MSHSRCILIKPAPRATQSTRDRMTAAVLALSVFVLTALLAGCAGGGSAERLAATAPGSGDGGFVLRELEGSIMEAGRFTHAVTESASGTTVSVSIDQARGFKAAYFELQYDTSLFRLVGSETGTAFMDAGTPLTLTIEPVTGQVQHGSVVANWPERDGMDGSAILATFTFVPHDRIEAQKVHPAKAATAVPASNKAKHYLNYNTESSVFLWYYVNPGDYDQNGEVSISDLTALGANFEATGPFPVTSALTVVDGDGNGVINISDITTIGANFGNSIDSFNIYGSTDPGDYPSSNTAANGAGSRQVGTRAFSLASGGGSLRKYWEFLMEGPIVNGRYWLRPQSGGDEGTPSQLTAEHQQQWHHQVLYDYGSQYDSSLGVSLASINDRPGVAFGVYKNAESKGEFLYQASNKLLGDLWNSPAPITNVGQSEFGPKLEEVNGLPTIVWNNDASGQVRFIQATDGTGSYWKSPTTVSNSYSNGHYLMEYDGRPVVVYQQGKLWVSLSIDSAGGTWMPAVPIYGTAGQWWQSSYALTLPGGIGAVTNDIGTNALVYCYAAIDGTTVTPASPIEIFPGGTGSNLILEMGLVSGKPFVCSKRGQGLLYYSYALDPQGSTWAPLALTGVTGVADRFGAGGAYDTPWACFVDEDTRTLYAGYAESLGGESWVNTDPVADYTGSGGAMITSVSMGRVGVHPAVAFNCNVDDTINFAAFY